MTLTEQRGWIASRHGSSCPGHARAPQSLDAEESVVAPGMLSPGAIAAVSEILNERDFYRESHSRMYRAALALYAKGRAGGAITLVDELEERGELGYRRTGPHPRAGRTRADDCRMRPLRPDMLRPPPSGD